MGGSCDADEEGTAGTEPGAQEPGDLFGGGQGVTADEIQEMMGQLPPELLAPDLPMVLASMASMLEDQAWRHLGLVANPVTHQVEKDLQKAKISIDVVA